MLDRLEHTLLRLPNCCEEDLLAVAFASIDDNTTTAEKKSLKGLAIERRAVMALPKDPG